MEVIKSICGCLSSINPLVTPYPYTHPIRPANVGMLAIRRHERLCSIAKSLNQPNDKIIP